MPILEKKNNYNNETETTILLSQGIFSREVIEKEINKTTCNINAPNKNACDLPF